MDQIKTLSKFDKGIIAFCIVCMFVCLGVLTVGEQYFWGNRGVLSNKPIIGTIELATNDTRVRSEDVFVWYKANQNDGIRVGDSVFSGEKSKLRVLLDKGGGIDVGENSLVVFSAIENQNLANLVAGSFKLSVDGDLKVAINGEVTTLKGTKSEVQLVMNSYKKPQMKLVKGAVKVQKQKIKPPAPIVAPRPILSLAKTVLPEKPQVKVNNQPEVKTETSMELTSEAPVEMVAEVPLEIPVEIPVELPLEPPVEILTEVLPEIPKPPEIPNPLEAPTVYYSWRLYDLYNKNNLELDERKDRPQVVPISQELRWASSQTFETLVQVSPSEDFQLSKNFTSSSGAVQISDAQLGENYWRVSADKGQNWSVSQKFLVKGQFLKSAQPLIVKGVENVPLINDSVSVPLDIRSPVDNLGYVVEASISDQFLPSATKRFWSPDTQPRLSFYRPGIFYYRFRTVTTTQELSDWSNVKKFVIFQPDRPIVPVLAQINKREVFVGESIDIAWRSNVNKIVTEVFDSKNEKIDELFGAKVSLNLKNPGTYKIKAFAANDYNQISGYSKPEYLSIQARIILAPIAKKVEESAPVAKVAAAPSPSEVKNSMSMAAMKPFISLNQRYKASQLSAQSFLWTLQSSQQYLQGEAAPVVTGLGLHGKTWRGPWGFEGNLKSGAVSVNQTGQQTAMKDVEGRVHYRALQKLPFNFMREMQVSVFGGYEMYRNAGALYSNQYDLIKFGTSLEFPVMSNWSTGGEILYGFSQDNSSKQEISGNVTYYLSRDWSLGCGYRLNLFSAGSTAAAAQGILPYKEGYTEGYSILNYHF
jgi:hypothetical protein